MAGLEHCYWKDLVDSGKEITFLTAATKEFFSDLGIQPPLKTLFGEGHNFVNNLAINTAKNSISVELRNIERDIVLDAEKSNDALPIRAISVIAVGKLFGNSEALNQMSSACKKEVEKLQLKLGFAAEFLFLSQLFHNAVSNVPDISSDHGNAAAAERHRENKIGTLVGDFLITKLFCALAELESNQVTETMMLCLAHLAEDAFDIESAQKSSEIKGGFEILFSQSFKCTLHLAGHSKEILDLAEELGQHFGQAYKGFRDLRNLLHDVSIQDHEWEMMKGSFRVQIENMKQLIQRIPNYSISRSKAFTALLDSMKLGINRIN